MTNKSEFFRENIFQKLIKTFEIFKFLKIFGNFVRLTTLYKISDRFKLLCFNCSNDFRNCSIKTSADKKI